MVGHLEGWRRSAAAAVVVHGAVGGAAAVDARVVPVAVGGRLRNRKKMVNFGVISFRNDRGVLT